MRIAEVDQSDRDRRNEIIESILSFWPSIHKSNQGRAYARKFQSIPTDDLGDIVDAVMDKWTGRRLPPPGEFLTRWEAIRSARYEKSEPNTELDRSRLGGPDGRGGRYMTVEELRSEYQRMRAETPTPSSPLQGERFRAFKERQMRASVDRIYLSGVRQALIRFDREWIVAIEGEAAVRNGGLRSVAEIQGSPAR